MSTQDWRETYDRAVRRYGIDSPEVNRLVLERAKAEGVPVGSKFTDQFGEYEVVGEPRQCEDDDTGDCFLQDVRVPEGHLLPFSVTALRRYVSRGYIA